MDDLVSLERAIAKDPALRAVLETVRSKLGDDPGHDVAHCMRVALWTVRLLPDDERVASTRNAIAAALLHDVVNVPKDSAERSQASERSAHEARAILGAVGFDERDVAAIESAIRTHSWSRGLAPESTLGAALQDADRLEALGAIGVLRTASCGAKMGASYFAQEDPWGERRALDDRRYTVDHFFTKLLRLEGTLRTAGGRAEARRRHAFLVAFLDQLASEIGVPSPGPRP